MPGQPCPLSIQSLGRNDERLSDGAEGRDRMRKRRVGRCLGIPCDSPLRGCSLSWKPVSPLRRRAGGTPEKGRAVVSSHGESFCRGCPSHTFTCTFCFPVCKFAGAQRFAFSRGARG